MAKRSAREVAAELSHAVSAAREAFLDAATHWVDLRHRFLIRTGQQPEQQRAARPPPRSRKKRRR